jgi:hypothetical protein
METTLSGRRIHHNAQTEPSSGEYTAQGLAMLATGGASLEAEGFGAVLWNSAKAGYATGGLTSSNWSMTTTR